MRFSRIHMPIVLKKGTLALGTVKYILAILKIPMNRSQLLAKTQIFAQSITQHINTKIKSQQRKQQYLLTNSNDDIEQPEIEEYRQQHHLLQNLSNLSIERTLTQLKAIEMNLLFIPSKTSNYFDRQKYNQYKDLIILKEDVLRTYGKVDKGYVWMEIGQNESQKIDKMACRNSQKRQYLLVNKETNVKQNLVFIEEDYEKLLPNGDLNDTIIQSYLKILKNFLLPYSIQNNCYFFSTYLLSKLLGDQSAIPQEEDMYQLSTEFIQCIKSRVSDNYRQVQRWTKKEDIFQKQILVIPINMFVHWFCVIVINCSQLLLNNPDLPGCQLIFCDSMFTIRDFVIQTIREYKLELFDKKKIEVVVNETNAPAFQLLLPRQTNTHDCGLYMLAYIEQLLINKHKHLVHLQLIPQRKKLHVFPRLHLHSLRQRIMTFFIKLYEEQMTPESTAAVIQKYLQERKRIFEGGEGGYDIIDPAQFKKFKSLLPPNPKAKNEEEQAFSCLIKFNLCQEANNYQWENVTEIDNTLSQMQLS